MKKFFMIFLLIAILSVSGCWKKDKKGCEPNPCYDIEHATDICEEEGWGGEDFSCVCEGNYLWDPRKSEKKCVDPCESKPCDITGSTGVCTASSYDKYDCECEKGFFWGDDELKCIDLCDPNPCKDISHSTGVCEKEDGWNEDDEQHYVCGCEENYFWDPRKCVNPCKPNPCGNLQNLKECIPKSASEYTCICKIGFRWNGEECIEMNECSPGDSVPCKDSSTGLIWSSKYRDNKYHQKCKNLSEGHLYDWETPSIGQLRTLIRKCNYTETKGSCEISEECCDESCYSDYCKGCSQDDSGRYSIIGDSETFWSGSSYDPESACFWAVNFSNGAIETVCIPNDSITQNIRCTRCLEDDYEWNGSKCVKKE